jgi:prepilin-type N-terminal cleavage/methylation domain-containing protein
MKKGFTLIELLVSVAIFTIVMVVALGALLSVSESDRKAQTLKTVTNNLNFALDSMSRAIRTGADYHCGSLSGGDCTAGDTFFAFHTNTGATWAYRWGSATCANALGCIQRSIDGGSTWADITSPEVVVLNPSGAAGLKFFLIGSAAGSADNKQPKVTIALRAYVQQNGTLKTNLNIQTTVTQRLYDQ